MKFPAINSVAQPPLAAGSPAIPARSSEASAPNRELPCSPHPQTGKPALHCERGIALIVTLILLSVVTFLAVAFLFLASREKGSVSTAVDQSIARLAAEAGAEQAKAEVVTRIIASANQFDYDLLVSRNYINDTGFVTGSNGPANVNYDFKNGGGAFSVDDWNQNIANLYYSPRAPVFIRTNRNPDLLDFRYFLDLNRNGRFEPNGLLPELDSSGNPITITTTNGSQTVSNNFVGDPEWIGILDHPDRQHGPNNKFVARMVYTVIPSGKTLDINTMHNISKHPGSTATDGFSRNMGYGTWEMNFPSFLVDLNTNTWNWNAGVAAYDYQPFGASTGTAFEDALGIVRYRYGSGLRSMNQLFSPLGLSELTTDFADSFGGGGGLMTSQFLPTPDPDNGRTGQSWPGAENPNHLFTTQDLFDRTKTIAPGQSAPNTFVDRLQIAGQGNSSYDRYTYYRLLAQLGTDSGPEPKGRINLNYNNTRFEATNFVAWNPVEFFTNAVNGLLLSSGYTNSALDVPVYLTNTFVYSPSIHRLFQLAANICDASTNYTSARGGADFPTVLRPTFKKMANGDIYIGGFEEVGTDPSQLTIPVNLNDPVVRANLTANNNFINVYGVPWVIGAKKGFPNFNEFAMQSVVQITRRLQMRRPSVTAKPNLTNEMFMVGISNSFAFEAWNSYRSNYTRAVDISVFNDMQIDFRYTNDVTLDSRGGSVNRLFPSIISFTTAFTNIPANAWAGCGDNPEKAEAKRSFQIPLNTSFIYLTNSVLRMPQGGPPFFTAFTNVGMNLLAGFENTGLFHNPQFNVAVSNRIRFIMQDHDTGRVIDYVHLNDLNGIRDLSRELVNSEQLNIGSGGTAQPGEAGFWLTNRSAGNTLAAPPEGVINQILTSLGSPLVPSDWISFGQNQASGLDKQRAIDGFRSFCGLSPLPTSTGTISSNTLTQVPFTPTRITSQYISWQANDPLVHYNAGDLVYTKQGDGVKRESPTAGVPTLENIGVLNQRYEPWSSTRGRAATKLNIALKDPGVMTSDNWDFPTHKFPSVGWLGRVHRGTPWQTIYLKASDVGNPIWSDWTGNKNFNDARLTHPVMDRVVFDVFTTALNDNMTRGQLNVNQTGLAAWSAGLGGLIGLTNSSDDGQLNQNPPFAQVEPKFIDPAGVDPAGETNSALWKIYAGIKRIRAAKPGGFFVRAGEILEAPELTESSPLLNLGSGTPPTVQQKFGIDDATYERIPQMLMGLVRGNDEPRFTIYAYGQALHPAARSIVTSGPFFGLCTNYQITAEFATRTVVRLVRVNTTTNAAGQLQGKTEVESFNILPPE